MNLKNRQPLKRNDNDEVMNSLKRIGNDKVMNSLKNQNNSYRTYGESLIKLENALSSLKSRFYSD